MYDDLLVSADLTLPEAPDDGEHVYHLYVVRSKQRDRLQAALRERGVGTDIHYPLPAHLQPIYAHMASAGNLPVTEQLAQEVLSLPIYPELTQAEVEAIAAAVRETL
jgi:dTDP-4-amino-4,6-dideoxygalactose transaminase